MSEKLSFEPKYHRKVSHAGGTSWMVNVLQPNFDPLPMRFINEVVKEQRQIEAEGGAILVFDPKGDPLAEHLERLTREVD